jgi:hypothetical protein
MSISRRVAADDFHFDLQAQLLVQLKKNATTLKCRTVFSSFLMLLSIVGAAALFAGLRPPPHEWGFKACFAISLPFFLGAGYLTYSGYDYWKNGRSIEQSFETWCQSSVAEEELREQCAEASTIDKQTPLDRLLVYAQYIDENHALVASWTAAYCSCGSGVDELPPHLRNAVADALEEEASRLNCLVPEILQRVKEPLSRRNLTQNFSSLDFTTQKTLLQNATEEEWKLALRHLSDANIRRFLKQEELPAGLNAILQKPGVILTLITRKIWYSGWQQQDVSIALQDPENWEFVMQHCPADWFTELIEKKPASISEEDLFKTRVKECQLLSSTLPKKIGTLNAAARHFDAEILKEYKASTLSEKLALLDQAAPHLLLECMRFELSQEPTDERLPLIALFAKTPHLRTLLKEDKSLYARCSLEEKLLLLEGIKEHRSLVRSLIKEETDMRFVPYFVSYPDLLAQRDFERDPFSLAAVSKMPPDQKIAFFNLAYPSTSVRREQLKAFFSAKPQPSMITHYYNLNPTSFGTDLQHIALHSQIEAAKLLRFLSYLDESQAQAAINSIQSQKCRETVIAYGTTYSVQPQIQKLINYFKPQA